MAISDRTIVDASASLRDRPDHGHKGRLPYIDGLRGLAILLVLVTHVWVFSGAPALSVQVGGRAVVLAALPAVGHIGVNLFLVLSGFCLAWPFVGNTSYRDRMTIRRFWGRRIWRIAPAYYISMALVITIRLTWAAMRGTTYQWPSWANFSEHLLFVHNFSSQHVSAINGSYWSLALEFQLYLFFPLLLEAMRRWGALRVLAVTLGVQLIYRLGLEWTLSRDVMILYEFVLPKAAPGRMLDFVSGMAVAHWVSGGVLVHSRTAAWVPAVAAAALTIGFAATYGQFLPESLIDVTWSFGFAALVWWASSQGTCHRLFSSEPLVWLGLISYSVYLLHQPLLEYGCELIRMRYRPGTAFFVGLATLPLIVGLCVLFYRWCEKPFLNWSARTYNVGRNTPDAMVPGQHL